MIVDLSESGSHYLANYYLLEQTREEVHRFLEGIAKDFSALVEEHLKLKSDGLLEFSPYVQKGGGYVEFGIKMRPDVVAPPEMKDWKYSIIYRDAMRTQKLSSSTEARVFGWTPKALSRQKDQVERVAKALELERMPYDEVTVDLANSPVDEVVDAIARLVVGYYDDYVRITQELLKETP